METTPLKDLCSSSDFMEDIYAYMEKNGTIFVAIYSVILIISYLLTLSCEEEFISSVFNFVTMDILMIPYIFSLMVVLQIKVDVDTDSNVALSRKPKSIKYRISIAWTILLIVVGIIAIYLIKNYKKQYAFDCSTVYEEYDSNTYHLFRDCSEIKNVQEIKGIDAKHNGLNLCVSCKETAEDAELDNYPDQP